MAYREGLRRGEAIRQVGCLKLLLTRFFFGLFFFFERGGSWPLKNSNLSFQRCETYRDA